MKKIFLQCGAICAMLLFSGPFCSAQTGAQAVYVRNCAMCHGATGASDTPLGRALKARPFTDPAVLQMTDSALNDVVMNGKGRMLGFAKRLTNDQVTALIQYIHQLQGK